jgi:hypothetical protein
MITPISVFNLAERGSKLNEPTKTLRRSTAKVLACSPAGRMLADLFAALEDRRRARLDLEQLHPGAQQVLAPAGIAGVHRNLVGAGQRVRQDPHPDAAPGQGAERLGADGSRHEVGRHQIELLHPAGRTPG